VVIFLHGIASHAGWFGETAADLNHQGIAVSGPDRRGSGRSGGPRGHLTRYQRALDDVEQVVQLISSQHRGTPVLLAASSWAAGSPWWTPPSDRRRCRPAAAWPRPDR
jgi:alpha-beta hydrolase superfamily lysophospholipase